MRAEFPILSREVYGKPLVFLDNGASAQKPKCVLEAVRQSYEEEYANVHRGLHYLSNTATQRFEDARESVRSFLKAPSTDQIIFTSNATDALNLVAQSFGGMVLGEGDEIVLSIMEHHSNIVPWNFHRERNGAVIKWSPVDDEGNFLIEEFEKLLSSRTKIVAITHMSNALGTIVPIKEVIRIAHERGIPVVVDGSQSAVHLDIDVVDMDCDFYVFTGHKTYGPSGIGVLYGKKEHLEAMPPYQGGGERIRTVTCEKSTWNDLPSKFEAGTPNIAGGIGLGAAAQFIQGIGRENIQAYESDLLAYGTRRLEEIDGLRIIGTAAEKASVMSFIIEGTHPHDIGTIIDHAGIAIRTGHHCAMPILKQFGVAGTARASLGMYNTREEIDVLVAAVEKACVMLR
ncbi:MAG: cysteine desulfurase [Xanthomonadales bacterium]|nr:cysteine desulfurase [Xanthomonadales bacterium]